MPTDPAPPAVGGVTLDPIDLVLSTRTYVAEMKEAMGLLAGRCELCDWPLYDDADKGCTAGSCSYRPEQPSEVARLRERRRSLRSLTRLTKLADATARLAAEVERLKAWKAETNPIVQDQFRALQEMDAERDALRTQLAAAEARVAEMEASITPPIHDENCMRGATAATCEGCHPEALVQWVRERLVNCMRIAATKVGDDRALWLDDARYFAAILQALAPPPPSEGAKTEEQ